MTAQTLAAQLEQNHYGDLFNYAQREEVLDLIWSLPKSLAILEEIVCDRTFPMKARFLACEVLFEKHFIFEEDVGSATIAEIYTQALMHNYTGMANSWGLLYEHDDAGPVGIRFVMIGIDSVHCLKPLLDNADHSLVYDGSEEATVGNAYKFRLKDYAAYYIGKILGIPVTYHTTPEARDAEINTLKTALADRGL